MNEVSADAREVSSPNRSPLSISGDHRGVVVLHGFTGSPASVRDLGLAFAAEGWSVELPLLPGHGSSVEDLTDKRFGDWLGEAEAAYRRLTERCDQIVVCGLSLGGTLALALAIEHADIAGVVVINPFVEPPVETFMTMMTEALNKGVTSLPSIGTDVLRPGVQSGGYDQTPLAPLLSLFEGASSVHARLSSICAPVLLFSSRVDHVVPPASGDALEAGVRSPFERVYLENSYHVATLDNEADLIEERAVAFANTVVEIEVKH